MSKSNNKLSMKNFALVITSIIVSYFVAKYIPVYMITDFVFPNFLRGELSLVSYESQFITYTFLVPFLFVVWGNRYKYWWTIGALIPVTLLFFNPIEDGVSKVMLILYFTLIALVGLGLGFLIKKLLKR